MSEDLKTVNVTQSLVEVQEIMESGHFRHVPVVSGDKVIGMVSKTDLLSFTYGNSDSNLGILKSLKIEDVMTKDLIEVTPATQIRDASMIFLEKDFSALPVVEDGKLAGLVTTKDIIRYLIEQY